MKKKQKIITLDYKKNKNKFYKILIDPAHCSK